MTLCSDGVCWLQVPTHIHVPTPASSGKIWERVMEADLPAVYKKKKLSLCLYRCCKLFFSFAMVDELALKMLFSREDKPWIPWVHECGLTLGESCVLLFGLALHPIHDNWRRHLGWILVIAHRQAPPLRRASISTLVPTKNGSTYSSLTDMYPCVFEKRIWLEMKKGETAKWKAD